MRTVLILLLAVVMLCSVCTTSFARKHGTTTDEARELNRAELAFSIIFVASLAALIIITVKKRRDGKG